MTGCAADADDLVQETFVRALSHPPRDSESPIAPLLVTIALNLSRDALRRRRRRAYAGTWLPSAVEEDAIGAREVPGEGGTEARYDLVESVSFAFLVALEALSPSQRAILVLRDVLDYSTEEAGRALRMSDANVKVTLHRARKAMAGYDQERRGQPASEAQHAALARFVDGLVRGDAAAIESVLAEHVVSKADAGGEFNANPKPVRGRARVARLFLGLMKRRSAPDAFALRRVGGAFALIAEWTTSPPKDAPRSVVLFSFDARGQIHRVDTLLATRKLTAIRFEGDGATS